MWPLRFINNAWREHLTLQQNKDAKSMHFICIKLGLKNLAKNNFIANK